MNRLIKFIAWDKKDNIMTYPKPMQVLRNKFFTESKEFLFLQFTGLYDNTGWNELTEIEQAKFIVADRNNTESNWNGKEIFEGDKVETNCGTYRVIFRDGMFELTGIDEVEYVSFYTVDWMKVISRYNGEQIPRIEDE